MRIGILTILFTNGIIKKLEKNPERFFSKKCKGYRFLWKNCLAALQHGICKGSSTIENIIRMKK